MNADVPRVTIERTGSVPVVTVDLPRRGLAAVAVVFPAAGASREPLDEAGLFATVASSVRFAGAEDGGHGIALERIGGRWIVDVDWDKTLIGVSAPAESISSAQQMLNEIMAGMCTERAALSARADRLDQLRASLDQPRVRATIALRSAIFGGTHRLSRLAGGDPRAVRSFEPERLRRGFGQLSGSPAAVVAAGDLCHLDTALLASALPHTNVGPVHEVPVMPVVSRSSIGAEAGRAGGLIHLALGHVCETQDRDVADAGVLEAILGSGSTSWLARRLRNDERLAYGVSARVSRWRGGGWFTVRTEVPGEGATRAIMVIEQTVRRFIDEGPTHTEVEEAKARLRGALMARLDTSLPVLQSLADMVARGPNSDHFTASLERLESVTVHTVRAFAAASLRPSGLTTVAQPL